MRDAGDSGAAIGVNENVELDEAMSFALVIGGDERACRKLVIDARGAHMLDAASHVEPRPQHHIVAQRQIADMQDHSGMDEPFRRVERQGFAHIREIAAGFLFALLFFAAIASVPPLE